MNRSIQLKRRTGFLFCALFTLTLCVHAQTPLENALSAKDTVTALQLIRKGENPNQTVTKGEGSLLIRYCRYAANDPIAFFLLKNGAKPDTLRSPAGRTALHVAAAYYAYDYALTADALTDLPEFRKMMEEACGFNKSETISFLKGKTGMQ